MARAAVQLGGILSFLVGIGHCFFYAGFGWADDLPKVRLLTARVLYTVHLFLIPTFFFFAYISFAYVGELAGGSSLGTTLATSYSLFWLARGLWQLFYFRPSELVDFKRLLPLHYLLVVVFFTLCAAYAAPVLERMG